MTERTRLAPEPTSRFLKPTDEFLGRHLRLRREHPGVRAGARAAEAAVRPAERTIWAAKEPDAGPTGGRCFGYTQISAGGAYTCGISQAGRAWCWGFNAGGQLGVGDQVDRPLPTAVSGDLTLSAITTGDAETCALAGDATAYCWGGYVGAPSPALTLTPVAIPGGLAWSSISGAEKGACGIAAGPLAYCWGADNTGQAGNGPAPASLTPARVLYQP
jgi:alpha-tubulin suppressor-like RCC1 family protein